MENKTKEQIIVKMYGGSRLYGLSTPQSDTDIVGIFLPNKEDLILQKIPEEYNLNNKGCSSCLSVESSRCPLEKSGCEYIKDKSKFIEEKYFSLHRFLDLCFKGIPAALEMLGSPKDNIIYKKSRHYAGCSDEKGMNCTSDCNKCKNSIVESEWDFLVTNRKKFFTKNLKGFLGYAKSQAHLYSRKGIRVEAIEDILKYLKNYGMLSDMSTIQLNQALNGELIRDWCDKYKDNVKFISEYDYKHIQALEICGKIYPFSILLKEAISRLENLRNRYGKRAEEASTNKADFKAISHAYRVIYEVMMIAKTGDLQFPFSADIKNKIMNVKLGKVSVGKCYDELEGLVQEAEEAILKSELPEKISNETRKFFDNWLFNNNL